MAFPPRKELLKENMTPAEKLLSDEYKKGDSRTLNDILRETIKDIDMSNIEDGEPKTEITVIKKQKTIIWSRVFLNEEVSELKKGDIIEMEYKPTGETFDFIFATYDKADSSDNDSEETATYQEEDDTKALCLMADLEVINTSEEIPFIRTLFKSGRHYKYQLMKKNELEFIIKDKNITLDYFGVNF